MFSPKNKRMRLWSSACSWRYVYLAWSH